MPEIKVITSKDNEQIKHIRKLKDKKHRDEYKEYVIEGIKLIKEAIAEKANVDEGDLSSFKNGHKYLKKENAEKLKALLDQIVIPK